MRASAADRPPETAWEAGRFDARRGQKAVLFGMTYEDPNIELNAFPAGGRVMCIASSGDTARALCARHHVVAVDINPVQVEYARRRLAGAPVERGKAERLMAVMRPLLRLAGIRRVDLSEFLGLSDPAKQRERWQRLCTWRFRAGMRVLFSFTGLRAVYASPFLAVLPPRFGNVLLGRFERAFATHENGENPYARALFLGESVGQAGPARAPVELVCADAAGYLESQPADSFVGVSLSNILDGASDAYRVRLFKAVRRACGPDGVVVLRSFAEPPDAESARNALRDRAMLWGSVRVVRAGELA